MKSVLKYLSFLTTFISIVSCEKDVGYFMLDGPFFHRKIVFIENLGSDYNRALDSLKSLRKPLVLLEDRNTDEYTAIVNFGKHLGQVRALYFDDTTAFKHSILLPDFLDDHGNLHGLVSHD